MNHNQYTTSCGKWKTLFAVLFLLAVLTAWVVTLATEKEPETWDSIHPIPNANISWDQTFYGGVKAD